MRKYRWQRLLIPAFIGLGIILFVVAFMWQNDWSWKPTAFWEDNARAAATPSTALTQIVVQGPTGPETVSVPVKVKGRTITVPHTVVSTHGELITVAGGTVQVPGPGQTITKPGGVTTVTGPGGTTTIVSTLPGTTVTEPGTTLTGPTTTETVPTTITVTLPASTLTQTDTVTETVTTTQPPVS